MEGTDQRWMAEALREARKGLFSTPPNPAVGCVVVSAGVRLASGWHEITGGPHAEVNAISAADIPDGCEFYITLEPCSHHGRTPPCVDAIIKAKPARVIVAMQDPNPEVSGRGLAKLQDEGIAVTCGVLENEARQINRGFVKRMEQGRPFVSLKMASSLDGRTALKNGISQWITSEPARRDVQFLRARASAILSSASTVEADNPMLNL
ncbi:MAG: bifunctional diaminohydroxyphosphoribosylaminopyrimidine deaminase/5-amino-6-(5-phosphoribosylamino)uracil reductase RibD, partial [Pseudomonadota bacterium]